MAKIVSEWCLTARHSACYGLDDDGRICNCKCHPGGTVSRNLKAAGA